MQSVQLRSPVLGLITVRFVSKALTEVYNQSAMQRVILYTLLILSTVLAVADVAVLGLLLIWLGIGKGYIACGRSLFDSPSWPLTVLLMTGIPAFILICLLRLARHCSTRLTFR
jgi:hypothetical protein